VSRATSAAAIQRRLDQLALDQLRVEAARLADENERLRQQLADAEEQARFWWEQATDTMRDLDEAGVPVGITIDGRIGALARVGGGA
jgi:hypothetical protein